MYDIFHSYKTEKEKTALQFYFYYLYLHHQDKSI